MQKMFKPARIGLVLALMAVMLTIYVSALYRMQIYETRPAEADLYPQETIIRNVVITAARGNIYDRNGVLLASGRPSYNISVNRDYLMPLSNNRRNEIIRNLVFTAMDEGVQYNDTFPITRGAPFTYLSDMTAEQRDRLDKYLAYFGLDTAITASDLLAWMRSHYNMDFTTNISEARLIIGVRYEIEIRAIITNLAPYTFANDVSTDFIALIKERGLAGVYIESTYIREYHTSNAANLLGYIRRIPNEDLDEYTKRGYPMDALVGRAGAELAFEEQMRGVNGSQLIRTSPDGKVMEIIKSTEPQPGQHVYLTMDIALQTAAEDALRAHIIAENLKREEESEAKREDENKAVLEKITGGAVAVIDVQTGEVLAAASFPTFNIATLSQDFASLLIDPNSPMVNRATQFGYNPGSTFKMITALTALRHNVIERYTEIDDLGEYTRYEKQGFKASCWIYPAAHGRLNVVQAIERSCNYFFMAVADWLPGGSYAGAEAIAEVAREFGLGQKTGLEIPETSGILSTPEYKRTVLKEDWYAADTLMTAFGQGHNKFTPVQLANYAATIANGGKLHSLTLMRRLMSADMSEVLYTHEPKVLNEFEETEYIKIIHEGMLAVARTYYYGTASSVFGDYPINVCAKTGTVQIESDEKNTGVFVCFAPAENPEIAISIVIEKGGSGSAVMNIARTIFDYYFGTKITAFTVPYGELIP